MSITQNISEDNDTNDTNDIILGQDIIDINNNPDDILVNEDEDLDTSYSLSFKDYFFQTENYDVDEKKKNKITFR